MSRAHWEAASVARANGFRSVSDLIRSKRKAERRDTQAIYIGAERRNAERRAMLDSAIVSNWTRRFTEARNAKGF